MALDGQDLRGGRTDDGRLVLFPAMTHQTERQRATVPGQITVLEGTTETTGCARPGRDCRADYLLTIKENRAPLHAAAITTDRDLAAARSAPSHSSHSVAPRR